MPGRKRTYRTKLCPKCRINYCVKKSRMCLSCSHAEMKGKPHKLTQEARNRLSQAAIGNQRARGAIRTPQMRKKLSEMMSGEKNPYWGKHSPAFGKKWSQESRDRLSHSMSGENNPMWGKHHSEETNRKNSEAHKGKPSPMLGKHHSEEIKQFFRGIAINTRSRIPHKMTGIEKKVGSILNEWGIPYDANCSMYGVGEADIYIGQAGRLDIECDGDYWHNLPGRKEKDAARDKRAVANGFHVLRISGKVINSRDEEPLRRKLMETIFGEGIPFGMITW